MTALNPRERERLDHFIDLLMFPVLDEPSVYAETHKGVARALLASRHRWSALDLAFLRWAAAGGADSAVDYVRLDKLLSEARERTA